MRQLIVSFVVLAAAAAAEAQLNRAAVSVNGVDTNPCTPASPCRTVAQAVIQVNNGGEVLVLDSGGYGAVSINRSMSIIAAPGIHAGITASGVTAVGVNLTATDRVVLRGLTLKTLNSKGIVQSGGRLHVENCVLHVEGIHGIVSDARLIVSDTVIHGTSVGIEVASATGAATAIINNTTLASPVGNGIRSGQNAVVTARRTVAHDGMNYGFTAGSNGVLNLDGCSAANFGIAGAGAWETATLRISNCLITSSGVSVYNSGTATTESWQNNAIRGNAVNNSGTPVSQN